MTSQEKDNTKDKKKRVLEFLKNEGIIKEKDTGQVVIHLNEGGITKICKNVEILK